MWQSQAWSGTSKLTDADRMAIAVYLKSVPAVPVKGGIAERGFEWSCHNRAAPARMTSCQSVWHVGHNRAVGQVW